MPENNEQQAVPKKDAYLSSTYIHLEDIQVFLQVAEEAGIKPHGFAPVFNSPMDAMVLRCGLDRKIQLDKVEACDCPECVAGRAKAAGAQTSETIH